MAAEAIGTGGVGGFVAYAAALRIAPALPHQTAHALLERALNGAWPIALQVLGEFCSATSRMKVLSRADAARTVALWSELMRPCAVSANGFAHALGCSRRTGVGFEAQNDLYALMRGLN